MKLEVKEYTGGNPTIDRLLAEHYPHDRVWMVNGVAGRLPIVAETEQEARNKYVNRD